MRPWNARCSSLLDSLLLYASIALTTPSHPHHPPPLLLRRYSGGDQENRQNRSRQSWQCSAIPGSSENENVNFSRGKSFGPSWSQKWASLALRIQRVPTHPAQLPSHITQFRSQYHSQFIHPLHFLSSSSYSMIITSVGSSHSPSTLSPI